MGLLELDNVRARPLELAATPYKKKEEKREAYIGKMSHPPKKCISTELHKIKGSQTNI